MKPQTTLIASPTGMVPLDGVPIDYARHNAGVTPHFFTRSEPRLDEDGKIVLDATASRMKSSRNFA